MNVRPENPVIVQGDGKVLVETSHRRHAEARDFLSRFAELEQSPEHLHTYRISPLSLWNAAAAGVSQTELVKGLKDLSKFDIPKNVLDSIHETMERYGLVKLIPHPDRKDLLRLEFATAYIAKVVSALPASKEMMVADGRRWWGIQAGHRGLFKQRMLTSGWPIEDLAGFSPGAHLEIKLRQTTKLAQKP